MAFSYLRDCEGPRAAGVATATPAAAAEAQNGENASPTFPAPTESVGCVAHGDHYDCAGPANGAATATAAAAAHGEEHEHENEGGSHSATNGTATAAGAAGDDDDNHEGATPAFPSPTESVGCVAHGDHYDCTGPASATQAPTPPATAGTADGMNGTSVAPVAPVAPFEGAASSLRITSVVGMTGLLGVIAFFVVV
ncbi:MAG: hypothetical protein Q9172_002639 [Xanthocarpia lactea]